MLSSGKKKYAAPKRYVFEGAWVSALGIYFGSGLGLGQQVAML